MSFILAKGEREASPSGLSWDPDTGQSEAVITHAGQEPTGQGGLKRPAFSLAPPCPRSIAHAPPTPGSLPARLCLLLLILRRLGSLSPPWIHGPSHHSQHPPSFLPGPRHCRGLVPLFQRFGEQGPQCVQEGPFTEAKPNVAAPRPAVPSPWGAARPAPRPALTWLGALVHGAVVQLVEELRPVVVHVDDVDVQVDGVLHLVAVHVHRVRPELEGSAAAVRAALPAWPGAFPRAGGGGDRALGPEGAAWGGQGGLGAGPEASQSLGSRGNGEGSWEGETRDAWSWKQPGGHSDRPAPGSRGA